MDTLESKIHYALRPDAQAFDEIRITTVPRYKESELSGNEWRYSARISFMRKGVEVHHEWTGNVESACGVLYSRYLEAIENHMKAHFGSDGKTCDQEGCSKPAKFLYRLKECYCTGAGSCGHKKEKHWDDHRVFCEDHCKRGDSDLEDNDNNYEMVNIITT